MGRKEAASSGGFLKKARESKKISIRELSRKTQLSPELLLAMEENRFESFSQPEFIPGYLRLYARQLGLDEAEALKDYQAFDQIPQQIKDAPIQINLFLDYNPPTRASESAKIQVADNNDNLFKHAFLILLMLLIISLFFYIPSEYKEPKEIRSDTSSRVVEMKKDAPVAAYHRVVFASEEEAVKAGYHKASR
jgi:cytoskeleton protein RodZ